jgi:hypothetical protein
MTDIESLHIALVELLYTLAEDGTLETSDRDELLGYLGD